MSPTDLQPQAWLILVADDDKLTRVMLRRSLEQEGYQVVEAANGEECLQRFAQCQPSLVLLDAMMPQMDGFDCCAELVGSQGNLAYVPVLMITGLEDQSSVDRAFDAGATDYITKPVHWAVLRRRVRLLLEKAHLLKELEEANRQLHNLALTDPLTGLANRRRFDSDLHREWRRATREYTPLSLILGDIDSFKPYNDTYGHPAGDLCLQQVGRVFQLSVHRPADLAVRYGGEEFSVILPNTNAEGAHFVAERILSGIWDLNLPHRTSRVCDRVTISLGVVTIYPSPEQPFTHIIEQADLALYQAKGAGGNSIIVGPELDPKV